MWLLLPLGLLIQLCVLFSLLCVTVPRDAQELKEVCEPDRIDVAERCVLFIGQQLRPEDGRARAKVLFKPNLFQWNGLQAILAGTPGYEAYNQYYPNTDNLFSRVDNVVYIGPETVCAAWTNVRNLLAITYPSNINPYKNDYNKQDQFVIDTFHYFLSESHVKENYKRAIRGKTIFVLYFTSVALNSIKYSPKSEETYEAEEIIRKYVTTVENAIKQRFKDGRTVFLAVPDWVLLSPNEAEVQVWGHNVSVGYKSPIQLEDTCPLLASLLGIHIPLGSVGKLPESFLSYSDEAAEKALSCNALQLYQLANLNDLSKNVYDIEKIINNSTNEYRKDMCRKYIGSSITKIHNIAGKFDTLTFILVSSSLIGWVAVILTQIIIASEGEVMLPKKVRIVLLLIFVVIVTGLNLSILCTFTFEAYRYVLFYHLPLPPFLIVTLRCKVIWRWFHQKIFIVGMLYVPCTLILVEIIARSFNDGFWAALVTSVISMFPIFRQFHRTPYIYIILWYITCFALVAFPFLLPRLASEKQPVELVNVSGTILMCLGGGTLLFLKGRANAAIGLVLILCLVATTMLSAVVVIFKTIHLAVYFASWSLLCIVLLPRFGVNNFLERILHTCLAFSSPLILMTRKLEPICYLILILFVFLWNFLERSFIEKMRFQIHHIRRGFMLLFSIVIGYLLMGKLDYYDFYDNNILVAFYPIFDANLYFLLIFLKYLLVFSTIFTVYYSVIKLRFISDLSFLYCYFLAELLCLRYLCKLFFFGGEAAFEIFNHLFINVFTIFILLCYIMGMYYSAPIPTNKDLTEEETAEE